MNAEITIHKHDENGLDVFDIMNMRVTDAWNVDSEGNVYDITIEDLHYVDNIIIKPFDESDRRYVSKDAFSIDQVDGNVFLLETSTYNGYYLFFYYKINGTEHYRCVFDELEGEVTLEHCSNTIVVTEHSGDSGIEGYCYLLPIDGYDEHTASSTSLLVSQDGLSFSKVDNRIISNKVKYNGEYQKLAYEAITPRYYNVCGTLFDMKNTMPVICDRESVELCREMKDIDCVKIDEDKVLINSLGTYYEVNGDFATRISREEFDNAEKKER